MEAKNINDELKIIEYFRPHHLDSVYKLYLETYKLNEPLHRAVGVKPINLCISMNSLNSYIEKHISFVVYLNEECIGFCINDIITDIPKCEDDSNLTFITELSQTDSMIYTNSVQRHLCKIFDGIERNYIYFTSNSKKIFKINDLCVKTEYEGKGIGTKLIQKCIEKALKEKCDHTMTVASAGRSAHIFQKLGFKCVRELSYESFLENGQKIIHELHDGNKTNKLMILEIQPASLPEGSTNKTNSNISLLTKLESDPKDMNILMKSFELVNIECEKDELTEVENNVSKNEIDS